MLWQDKLANKILKCPYQHIVFTMPHRLNSLARHHPTQIYNCLMKSAWSSLKYCCQQKHNLGATPGAIMVLHTFGSDLKYHVHVHCLVSFGGIDDHGQWQWPKRRKKIIGFREIRNTFRFTFIKNLQKIYPTLDATEAFHTLKKDLEAKSWCVHAEPPTANTKIIEEYLGRYICRIGLSKNRFLYDQKHKTVTLQFKDYRHRDKNTGEIPKGIRQLNPLAAMHQIIQHCLPAYFQKCRYYGLHASACYKKYKNSIPPRIRNNNQSVRTIFQIIKAMLGLEASKCTTCGAEQFSQEDIKPDRRWIYQCITLHIRNKGSPNDTTYHRNTEFSPRGKAPAMPQLPLLSPKTTFLTHH